MRRTLRAFAALLTYPNDELKAHMGEVRSALQEEGTLARPALRRLEPLLLRIEADDVLDSQAAYSELFDRSRSLALHLFEHVHGESRERGQAMVDLGETYARHGLLMESEELPDYVPAFLEFASCLPEAEAREMLGQPAHVFAALEERLGERGSDYAPVFGAILAVAGAKPDGEALAELQQAAPSDDISTIDEEWEEAPIAFTGPHDMGGPTGLVAKIRAARKAAVAAKSA
ncbi:nitrate reductase molybdenum cofactor assembly chaperone [Consotaella aegiceratis]|uniref:nitrate reductase molybdenum cofactor assembly chaperone n=1 Tax=Consotaella aegiceratis TaxID=3097961 RepID=UPI002F424CFC